MIYFHNLIVTDLELLQLRRQIAVRVVFDDETELLLLLLLLVVIDDN